VTERQQHLSEVGASYVRGELFDSGAVAKLCMSQQLWQQMSAALCNVGWQVCAFHHICVMGVPSCETRC
jgi:hypothetical protein